MTGATPFANLVAAGSPCSVTVHHENVANNAVQSAINAYPGGTICVASGTFPEQLTITAPGTILKGAGPTSTIIEPNGPLNFNTYDYDASGGATSTPAAAIILVEGTSGDVTTGTSGVTIENLEVNGSAGAGTFSGCGQEYFGVDFQASSGVLSNAQVLGVELPTALFGCQSGLAVYAYNGYYNFGSSSNTPDSVTISGTTINGFDKNAVTCDDPLETCTISSNHITGLGTNSLIAQNGIQVGFGAEASVSHNTVTATGGYDGANGCVPGVQGFYEVCSDNEGAGVLLYDPATGTSVSSNTLTANEYGVAYVDDGIASDGYAGPESVTISGNTIDSSIAYGIAAEGAPGGGDSVAISSNVVNNEVGLDASIWGAPGILVDTGTFTLTGNTVDGASTATGSSNGASQEVCGPSAGVTGPYLVCATATYLATAAIQAGSENVTSQTNVTISGGTFSQDSNEIATLGTLGGSVNLRVT